MNPFPGFEEIKVMHETAYLSLLKATCSKSGRPVIIQAINRYTADQSEIASFRRQVNTVLHLDIDGVLRPDKLEESENYLYAVSDDFDARLLHQWVKRKPFDLNEVLNFAMNLIGIIGEIHAAQLVIKDLNPGMILFNRESGKMKLLTLGMAVGDSENNKLPLSDADFVNLSLPFIAPEVTGRFHRESSFYSDYYSFGGILFYLLTQRPPFLESNPIKLINSILVQSPKPPSKIDQSIPHPISDIILKLLSKRPEERYQSVWGVNTDLERCLDQLHSDGKIYHFPLGQHDVSSIFHIPEKLYGRESQLKELAGALNRVSRGLCELDLVSGISGIGKTCLVNEAFSGLDDRKSVYLYGKFDQFQQDLSHSPIVSAFRDYLKRILVADESEKELWKTRILEAVGSNGQVLIEVMPEVELLIGEQPAFQKMGAVETLNRFNLVFLRFVRLFGRSDSSLILFLDDLQWADPVSLRLIELMLVDERLEYCLVVGAFRDSEVESSHPLRITIDRIRQRGVRVSHLTLKPLEPLDIQELIVDTFGAGANDTRSLASMIEEKSAGNPFYIQEFLRSLNNEKLVYFDSEQARWCWDLAEIQSKDVAGNVVEILANKIQRLKTETQQMLMLAACIGSQFDLFTLAMVAEKTLVETASKIQDAVDAGVVLSSSPTTAHLDFEDYLGDEAIRVIYRFRHDRIRQATLSLIFTDSKPAIHLQVGRLMLEGVDASELEDRIYDIVNQLNMAIDLIDKNEEIRQLVDLNLLAAHKAKRSLAHLQALNYFKTCIRLFDDEAWSRDYERVMSIYLETIEVAYLSQQYKEMQELARIAHQSARNALDKVKVIEIEINALNAQSRPHDAVKLMLHACGLLGYRFPRRPTKLQLARSLLKLKWLMFRKKSQEIIELPIMTDPYKKAVIRILTRGGSAVYVAAPQLFAIMSFRVVSWMIKSGLTPESPLDFCSVGMIYSGVLNDIDKGSELGKLSLRLLEKVDAKDLEARVLFVVAGFLLHWKQHARDMLRPLIKAYRLGLETGDFEYASYALTEHAFTSIFIGKNLNDLNEEMGSRHDAIAQLKQEVGVHYFRQLHQVVCNLLGRVDDPRLLIGEHYNEELSLPVHIDANDQNSLFVFYTLKVFLNYTFGDYQKALRGAEQSRPYIESGVAWLGLATYFFYEALSCFALVSFNQKRGRKRLLRRANEGVKKVRRWARYAPMNHLHKFYLLEAERYRVFGNEMQAAWAYGKAIALAREHQYFNEEALANELAARFYLESGRRQIAVEYLRDAIMRYRAWGAEAKVRDLESRYPDLIIQQESKT